MSQIAIYLDDVLEKKMARAAKREGKSRSAWVKEAIEQKIEGEKFSDDWFQLWGSWEDSRSTREILADIESGYSDQEREPLK